MTKRRLDYLQQHLTPFSGDLQALGNLLTLDIQSSLNKIRFITEKALQLLCEKANVTWGNAEPTLERMIGPLVSQSILPKDIAIHVRTIQCNVSPGSHYQQEPLSRAHLDIAKSALIEFLWWLYRHESDDKELASPEFLEEQSTTSSPRHEQPPQVDAAAGALKVGGISEVLSWGWDGVRLLDEFIRIDYDTLELLDGESEGQSQQWAPIFMNHPDTWRMLVSASGTIAGYWHFAPLFDEAYAASEEGKLIDSEVTIDRVNFFEIPGIYRIYICQVCLLPQYRTTPNIRLLLTSLFDVIELLADNGVFFSHVCANAYTPVGRSLCKSFNMTYRCPHVHLGDIYSAPISNVLKSPFALRCPSLRKLYEGQGLL